jgi:hypothetical protein
MAGIANSWIEQYTQTQLPCTGGVTGSTGSNGSSSSTFSSCILWLVVGLVLGSITFQKKGSTNV